MRHQYGISALVPQMKFCGKTSGARGIAKFRLFSQQATHAHAYVQNLI